MNNKKLLCLILAAVMCASYLTGCKQTDGPGNTTQPATTEPTTQPTEEPTTEPTTQPATEPATEPTQPPVDAQTLLTVVHDGEDGTANRQITVLDMSLNMPEVGMSMDMSVDVEISCLFDYELQRDYGEQTVSVNMYGQEMSRSAKVYSFVHEDEVEDFVYDVENEYWMYSVGPRASITDHILDSTAVMRELTEEYDSLECYVLDVELEGDFFQSVVQSLASVLGVPSEEDPDMSGVIGHMAVYVEKETMLIRGYEVTAQGLEEQLSVVLSDMFAAMGTEMEVSVAVDAYSFRLTDITYDPVEIPQISEEDKALAIRNSYDPDQGDGSYILQEEGSAVRITLPGGWEVYDKAYYCLILEFGNDMVAYCYMYSDGDSLKENAEYYADFFESYYDVDMTISEGKMIGEYETMICRGGGLYACMTQIQVGDAYLLIEVENYSDTSPFAFLKALAEAVEPVDLASLS